MLQSEIDLYKLENIVSACKRKNFSLKSRVKILIGVESKTGGMTLEAKPGKTVFRKKKYVK